MLSEAYTTCHPERSEAESRDLATEFRRTSAAHDPVQPFWLLLHFGFRSFVLVSDLEFGISYFPIIGGRTRPP